MTKLSLALAIVLFGPIMFAPCTPVAFAQNDRLSDADSLRLSLKPLQPFDGQHIPGVDCSTADGKVMCGYQGWFRCPGDGSHNHWTHYSNRGDFRPGRCSIDLWPDLSEFDEDEKHETDFRNADGSPAHVFSSLNEKTIDRHFRWMKDYSIDGVFVQRFAVSVTGRQNRANGRVWAENEKLTRCRAAANRHGRAYALMYDLTGMTDDKFDRLTADWVALRKRMKLGQDGADKSYLHHNGKPLVAIWGVGFSGEDRKYSLEKTISFINLIRINPDWGGCSIMLGVPTGWLTEKGDAMKAPPKLKAIYEAADIISPWSVGRYGDIEQVQSHRRKHWEPEIAWCEKRSQDYMPVTFPGFSWHNMHDRKSKLDAIPRQGGKFLWSQFLHAKAAGAGMVYVAMFDEMDEATAIFKCTNEPPVGESPFLTYEGLPSDHYLWLCGEGGKLIRGQLPDRK